MPGQDQDERQERDGEKLKGTLMKPQVKSGGVQIFSLHKKQSLIELKPSKSEGEMDTLVLLPSSKHDHDELIAKPSSSGNFEVKIFVMLVLY